MTEPVLTKEGQEIMDRILMFRPAWKKEEAKERYHRVLSLIMKEQGVKEAGKELVIDTVRLLDGNAHEWVFRGMEDPAKRKRLIIDPKTDLEAYFALPIQVKRWNLPSSELTKAPGEMKVLAINSSPRVGGNTGSLIDEALRGAKDAGVAGVEKILLQKIKMGYCIGCEKCQDPGWEGFCSQKDDVNDLFQKIAASDALIIGFPIYLGREPAQLCTLQDRGYCLGRGGKLGTGKRSMIIGTWGYPYPDGFDSVVEKVMGMTRGYGCQPVEALSACGFEGILHGWDDKGKAMILRYPKELEKAYQAGKALVVGR